MAVKAQFTSNQIEEAKYFGVSPELYVKLWEEAWTVRPGPRVAEWDRPSPSTFRSKHDGKLRRVYYYHDGCPITMEKVEGD